MNGTRSRHEELQEARAEVTPDVKHSLGARRK